MTTEELYEMIGEGNLGYACVYKREDHDRHTDFLFPMTPKNIADLFQESGQWQDRNYEPSAGNIIFFDWDGNRTIDHVGIVENCENGTVYTVEGNSGDACRQRSYAVGHSSIYGYGLPAY